MSNSSACSVSLPLMRTGTARLPRLSTAVSNLPVKRERPVPGWSSAPSSTNAADVDRALADGGADRILLRDRLDRPRGDARLARRVARRRDRHRDEGVGLREQPDGRRLDRDPGRGVAKRLERELVDDVAGVANPQLGRDGFTGLDGERGLLERHRGSHGRQGTTRRGGAASRGRAWGDSFPRHWIRPKGQSSSKFRLEVSRGLAKPL